MNKEIIKGWLNTEGKDRLWLADQLGVSKGTVDQWFSRGFPEWAIKSIERLMLPPGGSIKSSGLEVSFTADEFERIEAARNLLGLPTRKHYYESAINEFTDQILAQEAATPAVIQREVTVAGQKLKIIQPAVHYDTAAPAPLKVAEPNAPKEADPYGAAARHFAKEHLAPPPEEASALRKSLSPPPSAPPAPAPPNT